MGLFDWFRNRGRKAAIAAAITGSLSACSQITQQAETTKIVVVQKAEELKKAGKEKAMDLQTLDEAKAHLDDTESKMKEVENVLIEIKTSVQGSEYVKAGQQAEHAYTLIIEAEDSVEKAMEEAKKTLPESVIPERSEFAILGYYGWDLLEELNLVKDTLISQMFKDIEDLKKRPVKTMLRLWEANADELGLDKVLESAQKKAEKIRDDLNEIAESARKKWQQLRRR